MKRWLIALSFSLAALPAWALTPAAVNGCQYNATPPALTDKQTVVFQCDSSGHLTIAGTISATTTAHATAAAPSYGEGTDNALSSDLSGNLRTITNAGSVTNATLSAETTKVIGTVNQGTSPWVTSGTSTVSGTVTANAGTGNFTVVQPTGTNLHAVLDTTSTTAVTQATGANLHAVIDSGTITTVSAVTGITNALPAGTNLLGKASIDQTTPGTTNGVSLAQLGANTVSTGNGTAGTGTLRVSVASDSTGVLTANIGNTANTTPILANPNSAYPSGSTAIGASSGTVSNASAVATLAGTSGKTTYISGLQCYGGIATSANLVFVVVTGLTVTETFEAGVNTSTYTLSPTPATVQFNPPLPASATNTAIVVTMGASGAGGAGAVCNAQGFQL